MVGFSNVMGGEVRTLPKTSPRVVVVTGPTGCGKTEVATALAEQISGEIINADSVQVYNDVEIGSAAPTFLEQQRVPHHLFGIVSPSDEFDAWKYQERAGKMVRAVVSRGNVPIVAGGTGLYIKSLLHGLAEIPPISDAAREELEVIKTRVAVRGVRGQSFWSAMHSVLSEHDPLAGEAVAPTDGVRIERSLLVFLETGRSLVELQRVQSEQEPKYSALVITLLPPREEMYEKINSRVDKMLKIGLIEEVQKLRRMYGCTTKVAQSIGYRHVGEYLDGRLEYSQMAAEMKKDTRRFAKRQVTWWRNQPERLGWEDITDIFNCQFSSLSGESLGERLVRVVRWFVDSSRADMRKASLFLPLGNTTMSINSVDNHLSG